MLFNITPHKFSPLCSALILAILPLHAAHAVEFLAPQSSDLYSKATTELMNVPQAAPSLFAKPTLDPAYAARQREAVFVSWPMHQEVNLHTTPFLSQSREAYRKVTGAQLNQGVTFYTSSPRALVRLQALGETGQREKDALHPKYLQIKTSDGKTLTGGDGMETIVTADKLAKADLPFASGTSAFRVHPNLGSGAMQLQAQGLDDQQEYLLNVVEPDSPYVMHLQANASHFMHGQELQVRTQLAGLGKKHALKNIQAELVSPSGRVFPVKFKAQTGGEYLAKLPLDANEVPSPGLWEVRLHADSALGTQVVQRSARTSFAVALPVARFAGAAQLQAANGHLSMKFAIESANSGRYEVRGILYGTQQGKLVPLGVAHAANWLEAGKGDITLQFDRSLLQNASAPFEVRDLSLLDQNHFALLHKQARGVLVAEAEWRKFANAKAAGVMAEKAGQVFLAAPQKALKTIDSVDVVKGAAEVVAD